MNQQAIHPEPTTLPPQEPIAIIGMGCRFPGPAGKRVTTPAAYWQLLRSGEDIAREIPAARWDIEAYYDPNPDAPGKMYVRQGYFLEDVDLFDPQFFNLAPREVVSMDPQQRLLLETSWEALEAAGIAPGKLAGSQTGVFISSFWDDYSAQQLYVGDAKAIDRYATLSNLRSMGAGRLAHLLGVHGPNLQVDTACAASLTALHLACQSLRNRECDLAFAGGVYLLLAPEMMIGLCQMGALAADGRSKAFDRSANGFAIGEGCGMVLLKRLTCAQADGDPICAIIRGSAINHDGHSRTVTTPNGQAQRALLRQALGQAGVAPAQIQYVEAHGTGTELGDPIEVLAIADAFCQGRTEPLAIGSVKSNVGHLNAAAGMAGLFKIVLALQHEELPPTLHINQLNPRIPWQRLGITVPTQLTPWPVQDTPRLAGVSAFGLSGSNAHVIIEEAPRGEGETGRRGDGERGRIERPVHLLTLAAKSEGALRDYAQSYQEFLAAQPEVDLGDLCYTAHVGRSHFAQRLSVAAGCVDELQASLSAFVDGGAEANTQQAVLAETQSPRKIAFLFTGQGSQYVGMGRELYETQPALRATLDRCDSVLKECLGRSLLELLYPATEPTHNDLMESHPCGQASNFAIECALADLWRSWGIQPDFVLGHSLGDFAAAYTAGVLSLEDGLRLVTERGRLMEQALGSMVAVQAAESEVAPFLNGFKDVTIGVINGPASVVISGGSTNVARVTDKLQAAGFETRKLAIPVAAHSPMLDPVLDRFETAVRRVSLSAPKLCVVSSLTGQLVTKELTDPAYWRQHLRNTVRFADGVQTLHEQGVSIFLEIGPKPTLVGMAEQIADCGVRGDSHESAIRNPQSAIYLPSLREGRGDWQQMLESLGALYVRGAKIDWHGFDREYQRRKVVLPTYPFQRQRYWVEAPKPSARTSLRPLIDKVTRLPLHNETVFETEFSVEALPFLSDHRVYEAVVSPGACQLAMVLNAAEMLLGQEQPLQLADVLLPQALVLPGDGTGARTVQAVFASAADSHAQQAFKLVSFAAASLQAAQIATPATHATGYVAPLTADQQAAGDLAALQQRCQQPVDLAAFYNRAAAVQIELGPSFRWLAEAWQSTDSGAPEALAKVVMPDSVQTLNGYAIHPGLLDACFQVTGVTRRDDDATTLLPFAAEAVQLVGPISGQEWWCYARQTADAKWDIQLLNPQGDVLLVVKNFVVRAAEPSAIQGAHLRTDWLRTLQWALTPLVDDPARTFSPQCWLVFGDEAALTTAVLERLAAQGTPTVLATPGTDYSFTPAAGAQAWQQATVDLQSPASFHQLLATLATQHESVGIVYLWGMAERRAPDEISERTLALCGALLHLAQALAETTLSVRLWLVTQDCQRVTDEPIPDAALIGEQAAAGALWGLGRTIAQEVPACGCTCIDLGDADPMTNAAILQQEISAGHDPGDEPLAGQIAWREGVRYTARLADWSASAVTERKAINLSAEASYLITGGLGGLGLQMAEQLIADGAKHLVLSGRSGATTATAQAALERWRADGVDIQVVQADLSRLEDVRQLLLHCDALAPLRGIVHAAGLLDDGVLAQQSAARFAQVMQPKVAGTWHLHSLTAHRDLDFFVCFSSVASLLGSAGQSNYAAANAFMDTLMQQRRAMGLPGSSIQWGPWAEVGLAAHLRDRMQAQGMGMIAPHQGRALFRYLLDQPPLQVGVIPAKISALGQIIPTGQQPKQRTAPALRKQLQTAVGDERRVLLEHYLRAEIAMVLRLSDDTRIDKDDHLFQLGFDSLLAVELKNRVQTTLGCTLRSTLLFDHPTLSALTAHLDKVTRTAEVEPATLPLVKADRTQPLPLSFAQQRLWFNQTSNRSHSNTLLFAYRLAGPLDLRSLEKSLDALLERYEILRTVFPTVNGAPVQVITAVRPFPLTVIDLPALSAAEQVAAQSGLIQQEVQHLYDLTEGLLWRVVLATLAPEEHLLLFSFNHILIDGESLEQIFNELAMLYQACTTGAASPLPPLTWQYADYAAWQRRTLTPAIIESRVQYWVERLTGDTPLFELINGKPRPARESFRSASIRFEFSQAQIKQLQALRKANGATLFNVVLAAWSALLYRYGQSEELVVGAPFANRTHQELDGVIGHWVSMLLLPLRFAGNPTLPALIRQVNQATQDAIANDVPIDQLVQALPAARKRNNLPHQFLIRYLPGNVSINFQLSGLTVTPLKNKMANMRPDLCFTVLEEKSAEGSHLACDWDYKVELFEEATIVRMMEDFHSLLDAMLADPTCGIDSVLLPNRKQLCEQMNGVLVSAR